MLSYQLVSQHFLRVEVRDEEADVVALNLLPPEDDEVLCSPHHETHELVTQKFLDVVSLFDGDRNSNRVNAWLYQDPFLLVPGDDHGVEEELWRLLDLDLWLVVSLHLLTGEVLRRKELSPRIRIRQKLTSRHMAASSVLLTHNR